MPIYDYHCDHCGHTFSAVQSYTDATLERCPSCGKRPRKLMSTPAIVFKGGGWYKTDSRPAQKDTGDSTAERKTDSKTDGKGDAKGDGKGESKGESKGETSKEPTSPKSDPPKADAPAKAASKSDAASS
jgi:putative FmdB family regulatory protein